MGINIFGKKKAKDKPVDREVTITSEIDPWDNKVTEPTGPTQMDPESKRIPVALNQMREAAGDQESKG